MFEATLRNSRSPEFGAFTVEFPIPEDRYEETIRALEDLQIGDARKQDCEITDIQSVDCPGLNRLIGTMANVDELDWLGRKLDAFDQYELLQFQGAAERFELHGVEELIDLSFCSDAVTVISDFNDLEKVGRRHYLDAMRKSIDDSHRIFELLQSALTDDINSREIIMKGIDYSYYYETES